MLNRKKPDGNAAIALLQKIAEGGVADVTAIRNFLAGEPDHSMLPFGLAPAGAAGYHDVLDCEGVFVARNATRGNAQLIEAACNSFYELRDAALAAYLFEGKFECDEKLEWVLRKLGAADDSDGNLTFDVTQHHVTPVAPACPPAPAMPTAPYPHPAISVPTMAPLPPANWTPPAVPVPAMPMAPKVGG